jgi:hypothetical protein
MLRIIEISSLLFFWEPLRNSILSSSMGKIVIFRPTFAFLGFDIQSRLASECLAGGVVDLFISDRVILDWG